MGEAMYVRQIRDKVNTSHMGNSSSSTLKPANMKSC